MKVKQESYQSGPRFRAWLDEMKRRGLAQSDAGCGRLLGRGPDSVCHYKEAGTDLTVALACAALQHGLNPLK